MRDLPDVFVIRKALGHNCALEILEDDPVSYYLVEGFFLKFRRRFRKCLTVSRSHPQSKAFFKSTAEMYLEESQHLRNYYYMIHPFSSARISWELFMFFIYLCLFFFIPIELMTPRPHVIPLYFKLSLDVLSYVDIVLFFFTGYHDRKNQKIVLGPLSVFKRYLFTFFIFDVVSSFPITFCLYTLNAFGKLSHIKYLMLLKCIRFPTCHRYLHLGFTKLGIQEYNGRAISYLLWAVVTLTWSIAFNFLVISNLKGWNTNIYQKYDTVFAFLMERTFRVMRPLYLAGHDYRDDITTDYTAIMVSHCANIFAGCLVNVIILATITQIYNMVTSSSHKYHSLCQQVSEYMKYKELSPVLRDRVKRYLKFKFHKRVFKEAELLNTLSTVLRQDIMIHNCKSMVDRVEFFKQLPPFVMLSILEKLRPEIYLPNDVVIEAGAAGSAMYFIYLGTVAVYTSNDKEISHLHEGDHFGEIALLLGDVRVATVVAIKECELYKLSRKDFEEAIAPFPKIKRRMQKIAEERLRDLNRQMDSDDNDEDILQVILEPRD